MIRTSKTRYTNLYEHLGVKRQFMGSWHKTRNRADYAARAEMGCETKTRRVAVIACNDIHEIRWQRKNAHRLQVES